MNEQNSIRHDKVVHNFLFDGHEILPFFPPYQNTYRVDSLPLQIWQPRKCITINNFLNKICHKSFENYSDLLLENYELLIQYEIFFK